MGSHNKMAMGLLVVAAWVAAASAEGVETLMARPLREEYLIELKQGATGEQLRRMRDECNFDGVRRAEAVEVGAGLKALRAHLTDAMLENLKARHGDLIDSIEHDEELEFRITSCPNTQTVGSRGLWGLGRIAGSGAGGRFAHDPQWGAGVDIYVVDTGVSCRHPEFRGRCAEGYSGRYSSTDDGNGHGSHVAGSAAGATYGIARAATIIPVRAMDSRGRGTSGDILQAMEYVSRTAKRRRRGSVVNMSLGTPRSRTINRAAEELVAEGIHVLVAAGNERSAAQGVSPASARAVITVGATDSRDVIARFSNWGPEVDIFAPGVDILSAWVGTGTRTISGTSMATPYAAGVVAAYVGLNGGATPAQAKNALLAAADTGAVKGSLRGSRNALLRISCTGGSTPPTTPITPVTPPTTPVTPPAGNGCPTERNVHVGRGIVTSCSNLVSHLRGLGLSTDSARRRVARDWPRECSGCAAPPSPPSQPSPPTRPAPTPPTGCPTERNVHVGRGIVTSCSNLVSQFRGLGATIDSARRQVARQWPRECSGCVAPPSPPSQPGPPSGSGPCCRTVVRRRIVNGRLVEDRTHRECGPCGRF